MLRLNKFTRRLPWALMLALVSITSAAEERRLSMGWRFMAGEIQGAERPDFDDGAWRQVAVPHDFSILDKADGAPPFDPATVGGRDSGYIPGGTGWYRRHLTLTSAEAARVVRLKFEAVYMDSDIWLNGEPVGQHRYGYTAFTLDLTGKVKAGDNVIVVRARHVDSSSRWYAGSGLIRPVAVELLDPVHIDPDSVAVATRAATAQRANLDVRTRLSNRQAKPQQVEVVTTVTSVDGSETVARASKRYVVPARGQMDAGQALAVDKPRLWGPSAPHLYLLRQEVRVNGVATDVRLTRFGIRTVAIDAKNGLRINGEKVLLRGGNIHHDNYMLGAAGLPDADARKVALMKAAGYNAIRNAHNPASQATLDAADELGMLVINEAFDAWRNSKTSADYARFFADNWQKDLDSLIISGRNHPSVLFWSIGNEIREQGTPEGAKTARMLVQRVRQLDATRPVTQAVSIDSPTIASAYGELDAAGYNYMPHLFERDHEQYPSRVMYSGESLSRYAFNYWRPVETLPWVIGDFVWTSFDYLGEAGIGWVNAKQDWKTWGPYPWHLAYCGEIDATGRKRPAAYYRQVLWKTGIDPIAAFVEQPAGTRAFPHHPFSEGDPHSDWTLEDVHPSWSWGGQEGRPLNVAVYSEFPEVELFLNDKSLGRQAVGLATEYKARFVVPYAPGRLLAVGYRDGRRAGQWELRTAGLPTAFKATADRSQLKANGEDLAYVTIELADSDGVPIYARAGDRQVKVSVTGAGVLGGAGNGDPVDASSLQSGERKTFHGRMVAAVRAGASPGPIVVEVAVEGLPTQRMRLDVIAR
ncbi:glycoside hydrolase family 2 TIM barrel-domain containing protein [Roseateles sp. P5_D6]